MQTFFGIICIFYLALSGVNTRCFNKGFKTGFGSKAIFTYKVFCYDLYILSSIIGG